VTAPNFVPAAGGRIALGHRPKLRGLADLLASGCTHIVTLLSEREGAKTIGAAASSAGLSWIWFPLENGHPLAADRDEEARQLFDAVGRLLDEGGAVYIHCSAGIHRTGMIGYALLRHLGLPKDVALERLRAMRDLTADGVGDERLSWGDRFAPAAPGSTTPSC
jgi:protein-tyrosine phosphatase